jgi:FKBP-type peptidyl-prolyl cis-trans isomerase
MKGWDLGMTEMCVGEKRRLTIPPSLGFGDDALEGGGDIPGTKQPRLLHNFTPCFWLNLL